MLTLTTVQSILANNFFDGSMVVAGMAMYIVVLVLLFLVARNLVAVMLISLPVTLIFASMNILSGDLLIVLILVTVIGLGLCARGIIMGRD